MDEAVSSLNAEWVKSELEQEGHWSWIKLKKCLKIKKKKKNTA